MIAVCGATGRIGGAVLDLAAAAGTEARAVAEPGSIRPRSLGPAEWMEADFSDDESLRRAFRGAGAVLLVTPPDPRQVPWQRNIVDAAVASRVEFVVKVSAYASRQDSPTNMGRWHYDGELALAESGLDHAVLRPQYFMDNLLKDAAFVRTAGVLRSDIPPDHAIGMVDVRDVAATCFELLVHPRSLKTPVVVTGPEPLRVPDIAIRLSGVLGRPIRSEYIDAETSRRQMARSGVPLWRQHDHLMITEDCGPEVTGAVAEFLGRNPYSIEDFGRAHMSAFTG